MTKNSRALLVYAIPPEHLKQENGTSQRLQTIREALAKRFQVEETNLLDPPLRMREKVGMLIAGLLGLSNNLRYRGLAHRLPSATDSQLTLLMGNYCACLALRTTHRPLLLDLVDSLTLTDIRGIQSRWRWRPLLYLVQLPSSWLLEQRLKRQTNLRGVLITTEREQAWLERLHGSWPGLHVVPNKVKLQLTTGKHPPLGSKGPLQLAFIGSLHWWVNLVAARRAVQILERFLEGPGEGITLVLNLYGTPGSRAKQPQLKKGIKGMQIISHGYVDTLDNLAEHNHAAFLPNPIGRGFQNKLLSCVALGLPTIAHTSMCPHIAENRTDSVIYCQTQSDYEMALLGLWDLKQSQRTEMANKAENYIESFFSSTAISRSLNLALDLQD